MKANDRQVGGTHYQAEYQHWDLVIIVSMGYLEGCSTKYVTRWRKAEGLQDLQKGQHYLEKLIESWEIYDISQNRPQLEKIEEEVDKFARVNNLLAAEHEYVYLLASFTTLTDLKVAMQVLNRLIEMALNRPGTPDDGGHHSNWTQEPTVWPDPK